jgi:hypothetical protein
MSVDQLERPCAHPERYVVTTACIALRDEPTKRNVGERARHIGEDLNGRAMALICHARRVPQWR